MDKRVLVLVPGRDSRGGVTNYFYSLRKHLPENVIYLERGARKYPYRKEFLIEILRLINDYFMFTYYLASKRIYIVHTNTSFDKKGILRDFIYLLIAKIFRKKTIVFYRGWDEEFANNILNKYPFIFKHFYLKATVSIVLALAFKKKLETLNYKGKIFVETTTVDKDIIIEKKEKMDGITILYLARVEKEKGVFILLDAYKTLIKKYPNIHLKIGGDGKALDDLKIQITNEHIPNVEILGFVAGKEKSLLLANADIFVFPTYYKEGMPNSVLEAFAFGLPVITRPVAGLYDIFKDGINGCLIESISPIDFAQKIELLINNNELRTQIAQYNKIYARQFISDHVAERLLHIYDICN